METFTLPGYLEDSIGKNFDLKELARVIVEHRERYLVQSSEGVFQAEITGNIRFTAQSRSDFPAVGDWVRITKMDAETAIILEIFPRQSVLSRQAVGKPTDLQLIACNIDIAFIVQAVGHDFNLNRLERYLSICNAAGIKPVMLLTKTDLIGLPELDELIVKVRDRVHGLSIVAISNENGTGLEEFQNLLEPAKTYCFLGSSGVGKSTVINHFLQGETLKTAEISNSTSKGKHTTTHRELFRLPNGSLVIDTPGMRELGMTDQSSGIEMTFDQIAELTGRCKYHDCSHTNETGCAVLQAVEEGELSEDVYQNYMKLKREQEHFSSSTYEKRKKDKAFGKMIKNVLKEHKRSK